MDSLRDFGLNNELEIQPGIIMIDKDHRKTIGPRFQRDNKMTLEEY